MPTENLPVHDGNITYLPPNQDQYEDANAKLTEYETAYIEALAQRPWMIVKFVAVPFLILVDVYMVFTGRMTPFLNFNGEVPDSLVIPLTIAAFQFVGGLIIFEFFFRHAPDWLRKAFGGFAVILALIMIAGFALMLTSNELLNQDGGVVQDAFSLTGLMGTAVAAPATNPIEAWILKWAPAGQAVSHAAFAVLPIAAAMMLVSATNTLKAIRETRMKFLEQKDLLEKVSAHDLEYRGKAIELEAMNDPTYVKVSAIGACLAQCEPAIEACKAAEDAIIAHHGTTIHVANADGQPVPQGAAGGAWDITNVEYLERVIAAANDENAMDGVESAYQQFLAMIGAGDDTIVPPSARSPFTS